MKLYPDITITPNSASIKYTGSDDANIELLVQASGSLSYQGSGSGQLFNIENTISGTLMAVTDISGIPILEVFSNNEVNANGFRGWRPYSTQSADFTPQLNQSGYYMRCGGTITASIDTSANVPFALGTEIEFIQTESSGNTKISGSNLVTVNSKNSNYYLAGQWSAATIKKVGTDEWDLIGDLT